MSATCFSQFLSNRVTNLVNALSNFPPEYLTHMHQHNAFLLYLSYFTISRVLKINGAKCPLLNCTAKPGEGVNVWSTENDFHNMGKMLKCML